MKILLVDDEQQVLRGVSRMIESEMDHWDVETAESGFEALELLESEEFNVIVSDMRMPGMNGAQLLEQVEQRFPNLLRIILSGQADRETVLSAVQPMHQYLSKPCNPQTLIEIIGRAEVFQETITSSEVLDAIGKSNCMPSLPSIVMDINKELENAYCTSRSIANVVSHDPILSARILQLANSAIFGLRQPVVDLDRGIGVVGYEMIRTLAMSQAIFSKGQHERVLSTGRLFEHCFQVAAAGRVLASATDLDPEDKNSVFSGGLLHDIGKIVLLNAFPQRYESVLNRSKESRRPVWMMELEEFGASHQGVGAYLLELWGVPSGLIDVVAMHHSFELCAKATAPCQIVFAANWIANGGDEGIFGETDETADARGPVKTFRDKLMHWKTLKMDRDDKDSSDG